MTVYVVQEILKRDNSGIVKSKHDLTPAAKHGNLVFLLPSEAARFSVGLYAERMAKLLANYSDSDYILPVGDPAAMMIAGALAAKANNGRVNVLSWDRLTGGYLPVTVQCW
jgi:hypothetical protein